ncbi:hypothetical protein AB9H28_24765 [Salmonella enterica subsp. enterica serovar Kentucky]|uniref:hypothetical protein n=1 Tax=Salmonella enterica TaxID=28901 RepID=UPI0028911441|nr:hypothetical protein [Salmonella enterica]MDT1790630.1 hypothetical protein [Salmonella enterica subsp. enterica serovar Oslo]
MNTTMTTQLPTSGQFVMLNEFEGKIWGQTYRYNEEKLEVMGLVVADTWSVVEDFEEMHADINILGYIVEA